MGAHIVNGYLTVAGQQVPHSPIGEWDGTDVIPVETKRAISHIGEKYSQIVSVPIKFVIHGEMALLYSFVAVAP